MYKTKPFLTGLFVAIIIATSVAQSSDENVIGIKLRIGGRFDNVRMCIASPAGAKGGLALEVSIYSEVPLTDNSKIAFDIPIFRPILFGIAFKMLQFDPDVNFLFRKEGSGKPDFVLGPTVGLSLHYGSDYKSDKKNRSNSFWAIGPRFGGYFGVDFKRPEEKMNFQLGIHPYITPMFTLNTTVAENGVIAGATLDGTFRF